MKQAEVRSKTKGIEAAKASDFCVITIIMRTEYNPNQNPRVIIIQKLYGNFFNNDKDLILKNIDLKNLLKMLFLVQLKEMNLLQKKLKKL